MKLNRNFHIFQKLILRSSKTFRNSSSSANHLPPPSVKRQIFSPFSDIVIPQCTVHDYVWCQISKWADKTAIVCSETTRNYKYHKLYSTSQAFATNLRKKLKLQAKDVVTIVLPNVPEYPIAVLGTMQSNMIVALLKPPLTSQELHQYFVDSKTKCVITSEEYYSSVNKARRNLPEDIPLIVLRDYKAYKLDPPRELSRYAIDFYEMCDKNTDISILSKLISARPDDVCLMPFSSGRAGLPKVVELTHKNIVASMMISESKPFETVFPTTKSFQDIIPAVLPFATVYGLTTLLLHKLACGCKIIAMEKFSLDKFVILLNNFKISMLHIIPALGPLLKHEVLTVRHFSRARYIISTSSAVQAPDAEEIVSKFRRLVQFFQVYGMTEAAPITMQHCAMQAFNYATVGDVVPNTKIKILDLITGESCKEHQSGEIVVKGPQIMKRYFNNPIASKESFTEDGWLKTGDIGVYDNNRYLYLMKPKTDVLKIMGHQVSTLELEELLRTHPHVKDVVVIGIPNKKGTLVPQAIIVPANYSRTDDREIKRFIAKQLSQHKHLLGGVKFVKTIPKDESGNILEHTLRQEIIEQKRDG